MAMGKYCWLKLLAFAALLYVPCRTYNLRPLACIKVFNRKKNVDKCNKLNMMTPADMIEPSYNLAAGSASIGLVFGGLKGLKGPTSKLFGGAAIVFTLFGAFVAFQTSTLRFQFSDTNFALVKADGGQYGENVVVGGENSWKYQDFVNWDFLPNENFPILVYFKEVQTPRDNWVEAPIVVDNLEGQAHFFPAIANTQSLKNNFIKNQCSHVDTAASPPTTLKMPTTANKIVI